MRIFLCERGQIRAFPFDIYILAERKVGCLRITLQKRAEPYSDVRFRHYSNSFPCGLSGKKMRILVPFPGSDSAEIPHPSLRMTSAVR